MALSLGSLKDLLNRVLGMPVQIYSLEHLNILIMQLGKPLKKSAEDALDEAWEKNR